MSWLRPVDRHFRPGCPHERAHQGLSACLDAEGADGLVGVSGGGCGSLVHAYLDLPFVAAPPGRGISVARGLLLARPAATPLVYASLVELGGEGLDELLAAAESDASMAVVLVDDAPAGGEGGSDGCRTLVPGEGRVGLSRAVEGLLRALEAQVDRVGAADDLAAALARGLARARGQRRFSAVLVGGPCPEGSGPAPGPDAPGDVEAGP